MAKDKDGPQPAKPGLLARLKWIGGKIWDELKPAVDLGRAEAASALFSGQAYVLYPRAENTEPVQGPESPAQKPYSMDDLRESGKAAARQAEKDNDGMEQDRGRER